MDAPPDLLLLDFNLPGLHGEEILKALHSDGRTSALKVVVISGVVVPERLFDMGCQGFLAKPLDSGALRQLVDALVNNRG
jgi:CheY-like chemotaxis protein